MNMKKKIVTVCLVACMALTAVAGGTLAYFTDTKEKTNTFTVGNVTLELTEPNWEDNSKLMPGKTIKKDPTVELTSTSENAWVFVELDIGAGLKSMMEATKPESAKTLHEQFEAWVKSGEATGINSNWKFVKEKDNKIVYRYTDNAIAPKTTEALFNNVVVPGTLESKDIKDSGLDIKITAKAIQSEGVDSETAFNELFPEYNA